MSLIIEYTTCAFLAYLLGSIPSGTIISKLAHINNGSNHYVTANFINLWSNRHKKLALLTALCEFIKLLFIFQIPAIYESLIYLVNPTLTTIHCDCGKFCAFAQPEILILGLSLNACTLRLSINYFFYILGQIFPLFNKFKGNTGTLLILLAILTYAIHLGTTTTITIITAWILTLLITRYLCLANLVAIIAFPITTSIAASTSFATTIYFTFLALLVILGHRGHIARLLNGQEPKFSLWKKD